MRCFIAIEIPEKIKKEIEKIQKQLPGFKGKLIEPENLHLTLKFLGEINSREIEQIKEKLSEIEFPKFTSEIDSIGFFNNRKSFKKQLIIWLHIKNCEGLQKLIDNKLSGLFPKEKRFMSHLTIARIKDIKNKKIFLEEIEKIKISKLNFDVDKFYLKESILTKEKPFYKDISVFYLKKYSQERKSYFI